MDESGSTIDSVFTMREVVCKPTTLIKLPAIKWRYDERITTASSKLRTRMHARTIPTINISYHVRVVA